jgi:hypothetical protein
MESIIKPSPEQIARASTWFRQMPEQFKNWVAQSKIAGDAASKGEHVTYMCYLLSNELMEEYIKTLSK